MFRAAPSSRLNVMRELVESFPIIAGGPSTFRPVHDVETVPYEGQQTSSYYKAIERMCCT